MVKHAFSLAVLYALFCTWVYGFAADHRPVQHVLLISVDGLHQSDLDWFIATHPHSALAHLAHTGIEYTDATAPFPSDSYPGLIAQVTGGNPKSTGVYYDDAYSRSLFPPGTADCSGKTGGSEIHYANNIDRDKSRLDAGQDIPGLYDQLPRSLSLISSLRGQPDHYLIDAKRLPVDPTTCQPLFPHQYLKVNTVFEVVHAHGGYTAWADKHPSFEIVSGPSGQGVDDLFTPEVNSSSIMPLPPGRWPDFASDITLTQRYDTFKLHAVLNWLHGHDHTGSGHQGEPALFGLNFQSVSAAQRNDSSHYFDPTNHHIILQGAGGYILNTQGQPIPGPVLSGALAFVDHAIGKIVDEMDLANSVVIISAKHGQSPKNRNDLIVIDDNAMIDALNRAWHDKNGGAAPLVAHAMDDDGVLLWLNDRTPQATVFAAQFLMRYNGNGLGFDPAGKPTSKPFQHAGLQKVYAGSEASSFIGVPESDDRVPDIIGIARIGSIYAGNSLQHIAEHGGDSAEDRHVALLIAGAGVHHRRMTAPVETTQIAPTILALLNLNPWQLQAVRIEGTRILPGM